LKLAAGGLGFYRKSLKLAADAVGRGFEDLRPIRKYVA
jgi:hypothetical protein